MHAKTLEDDSRFWALRAGTVGELGTICAVCLGVVRLGAAAGYQARVTSSRRTTYAGYFAVPDD